VPKTRSAAAGKAVESSEPSAVDRQRSLTWGQRLKRVFACSASLRLPESRIRPLGVASLAWIERILEHLGGASESADPANPSRAPPQGDLLG
jgi:hypothetical protein